MHTALVCTAKSCPPIAFYEGADYDTLTAQLDLAAANFVNTTTVVDQKARQIRLHLVLHWYAADFGGQAGVLDFVETHADPELRTAVQAAREANYELAFARYDWSLNQLA